MRTPQSRPVYVCILCVVLSALNGTRVVAAQSDNEVDRFATAYRTARTEFERRAVCLDAIDAGVVARDRPVGVVDAVFGTRYATKLPKGTDLQWGVVHFHPALESGSDKASSGYIGWYLAFQFDSAGKVQNYYLSNVHK